MILLFSLFLTNSVFLSSCQKSDIQVFEASNAGIIADSLYRLGKLKAKRGEYHKGIHNMKMAYSFFKQSDSLIQMSNASSNIGLYYYYLGEYDSSLSYYNKALSLDSLVDMRRLVVRFKNLGILENKRGKYYKSIRLYRSALEVANKYDNKTERASINYSIGNLLNKQKRYDEALKYHFAARERWGEDKDTLRLARALNNLGNDYFGLEDYILAIKFYKNSLFLKRKVKDDFSLPNTLNNLGEAYIQLGQLDSAEIWLKKTMILKVAIGNRSNTLYTTNNLADLYLAKGNFQKAMYYLNYDTLVVKNKDLLLNNLGTRWRYHEAKGNVQSALRFHKQWSHLRDSLFHEGRLATLSEVAEAEKEDIRYQKRISDQKLDIQRNRNTLQALILVGVFLFAIIFAYLFLLNRRKKRVITGLNQRLNLSNKQLDEANRELKLINRDISHRKRNDYSRIIDLLEEVNFPAVQAVGHMLYASSALDDALYQEKKRQINLNNYLNRIMIELKGSLRLSERGIAYDTQIAAIMIDGENAAKVAFVISELVTNAVKHAFPYHVTGHVTGQPLIVIQMEIQEKHLHFTFKDNGEPFHKDTTAKSIGIGVTIMNGFLKSLGAAIDRARDEEWNIATFSVLFDKVQ